MPSLYACVTEQHDFALVGLAAVIGALGIHAAVALAREASRSAEANVRRIWGVAAAVALASAIWATHFIAMLAYRPGMTFRFDIGLTMLSYGVALTLVGMGGLMIAKGDSAFRRILGGGVVGLAISAMHYTGMSAYQVQGYLRWDVPMVLASILCGAVLSAGAVAAATATHGGVRRLAPILLTLAVCLAHFLGMTALALEYDPGAAAPSGALNDAFVVQLVANVALVIVGLSLAAVWLSVRVRRHLVAEKRRLRDVADVAVEGLMICSGERVVEANSSLEAMLGGERDVLIGKDVGEIVPGLRVEDVPFAREIDATIAHASDGPIPVRITGKEIFVGRRRHVVVAVRDQRERLQRDAEMTRLAYQDTLTALANRLSFTAALAARCSARRKADSGFALLTLDLDRFKSVNDTHGHGIGDELLRRVAGRLRCAVRETDVLARLGGDEFSILAPEADDLVSVRAIAERVIDLLGRPFLIDGKVIDVSASVGVAFAPVDGDTPEQLARAADLALYQAKKDGGDAYRLFEAEMNASAQAKRALEFDLRWAAGRQEFQVHYQPLVDARTGAFEGAEALIRWPHPLRGMVPPSDFIPLAEEIGLIGNIGEWVLRTACGEAASWPGHLKLAVNLSPLQLRDPQFVRTVAEILEATGLAGERLELEITENALLQDEGDTLAILNALRALGIRISMDDFGTGYSSLSYLRRFPFDKIKIDQSFIRQLPGDKDSAAIVEAIASLGAKLGMTVTAEGVETVAQRSFAMAGGCDQIQGYLISRPVPAAQIAALFSAVSDSAVA